ncbi:MAG: hypothetical protein DRQ47_04740, partial [Gammaproteobacteria bacterium]
MTKTELTRKQREIRLRHELILGKARDLFIDKGYHSVTMDMIAKETEYSKGTIYQHFNCKEGVITSLCTSFCKLLIKLFELVIEEKQLNPRFQMILILEAFILIQELCKDDVQLKNLADSESFCTKVPVELIEETEQLEQQTFAIVIDIVNRAMANKQLKLKENVASETVAI